MAHSYLKGAKSRLELGRRAFDANEFPYVIRQSQKMRRVDEMNRKIIFVRTGIQKEAYVFNLI